MTQTPDRAVCQDIWDFSARVLAARQSRRLLTPFKKVRAELGTSEPP